MDKLFTEVSCWHNHDIKAGDNNAQQIYSDDTIPYGPISFLATTWKASSELSGYAQQDAHEFFLSTLNHIHLTSQGSTNVSCNCIIHSTFAGQLQSDVRCERCNNVTTTIDPMLDIPLELKGKGGEVTVAENTLAACLRRFGSFGVLPLFISSCDINRFTHPEKLGQKEYSCSKCGKATHASHSQPQFFLINSLVFRQEASKRLSIRKLPPVLSFQFKVNLCVLPSVLSISLSSQRFEHKNGDKSSARKIDATIRFPASLNMAPYTTLAMQSVSKEQRGTMPVSVRQKFIFLYFPPQCSCVFIAA